MEQGRAWRYSGARSRVIGYMKSMLLVFGALAAILSAGVALGDDAFERALSLANEKRYPEAREVLDSLLEDEPGHPRGRVLHGVLRAREGRIDEAIDIFEALRRDHPDISEPYNNLAVLYALEGRLDDARRILLATLERWPDPIAYSNLGDVYTKLARRAYRRAREHEAGRAARPERVDADPQREADAAVAVPPTPDDSSGADPPQGVAPSRQSDGADPGAASAPAASGAAAARLPDAAAQPEGAEARRPDPVAESREAAVPQDSPPESQVSAVDPPGPAPAPPIVPATAPQTDSESPEAPPAGSGTDSEASDTEPGTDAFCAYAGGFRGRRAVADAALWLQSHGAEVLEVRHEERRTATSYQVYLPPLESRAQAVAKVREIRRRGVRDVALIKDGDLTNGVSFGVYREADNMHRRVAALDRLGYAVRSRAAAVDVVREYAIKARAAGTPDALGAAWAARFPEQSIEIVDCG